jgi:16S rRNA processing protein RimM
MGWVRGAYGVHGMLHVQPVSEDPLALTRHPVWCLRAGPDGDWRRHAVGEVRAHGAALVAALDGIATREQAGALRGAEVGVARSALPALAPGQWYWADLEGLAVVNRDGVDLGKVVGLLDNGAHAVLRVRHDAVPGERLVPWVPAHVVEVDLPARRIEVDWPADF